MMEHSSRSIQIDPDQSYYRSPMSDDYYYQRYCDYKRRYLQLKQAVDQIGGETYKIDKIERRYKKSLQLATDAKKEFQGMFKANIYDGDSTTSRCLKPWEAIIIDKYLERIFQQNLKGLESKVFTVSPTNKCININDYCPFSRKDSGELPYDITIHMEYRYPPDVDNRDYSKCTKFMGLDCQNYLAIVITPVNSSQSPSYVFDWDLNKEYPLPKSGRCNF